MDTTFRFFDPSQEVTITHGHLPHWDQAGATYFITWRTADSVPTPVMEKWKRERDQWLLHHQIHPHQPDWRLQFEQLSHAQRADFRQFTLQLESELDAHHGSCPFRDPALAQIAAATLHHFDGSRYLLGDYVIMPNHVHLLVGGLSRQAMLAQVTSWKRWSAKQLNQHIHRTGRFWQDEHFDHLVRSSASFQKFRDYIAQNPKKAHLPSSHYLHWQRPPSSHTA